MKYGQHRNSRWQVIRNKRAWGWDEEIPTGMRLLCAEIAYRIRGMHPVRNLRWWLIDLLTTDDERWEE